MEKFKTIERRYKKDGTPKRDAITVLMKKQIIDAVDAGEKYESIKQRFNLKNISNVSGIYKNKLKWLQEFEKDVSPYRKTTKTTKYANIDRSIRNFIIDCHNSGSPAGFKQVKTKLNDLIKETGQTNLKCSNGHIQRLIKRNQIVLEKKYFTENSASKQHFDSDLQGRSDDINQHQVEYECEKDSPIKQRSELINFCSHLKKFSVESLRASECSRMIDYASKIENILTSYQPSLVQTKIPFLPLK